MTCADWFRGGGGKFYRRGCILPLYSNCCQNLASYFGSSFVYQHQKVKYPFGGQIKEILGDQALARQCMVVAIQHKLKVEPSAYGEKGL